MNNVNRFLVAFLTTVVASHCFAQPTTQPGTDSFAIILPTTGMAPCTIHVQATDIPLAHGTPLTARYQWDFGDPSGKYNQLTGWNAAHIYDRAGRYTITLTLTDQVGDARTIKREIVIAPDTRRAVYVSTQSGSDTNNGADPQHAVRSVVRVNRLVGRDTKILFHRGETFESVTPLVIAQPNVLLGDYDEQPTSSPATSPAVAQPTSQSIATDSRPMICYAGPRKYAVIIRAEKSAGDLVIENLAFDSVFDQDTEVTGMPDAIKPGGENITVRNCRFLNLGDGLNLNGRPRGVIMQDCDAPLDTGIRGYLAWCEGSDLVFLGNFCQNSTRQHTLRVGGADRILIAQNNLSNSDRRPFGDKLDWNNGALTIHEGSWLYACDNIVNHGLFLVGPLGDRDGLKDPLRRWHWAVIERNRIGSWVQIVHGTDHVMIRNNVIRRNDWACIEVEGFDTTYNRGCVDVTIANNTGMNIGAKGFFLRVTGPVAGLTLANNLYVAPKIPGAQNNTAAVWVKEPDLSSFRAIAHNIWPECPNGRVNSIDGKGISPDAWLKMTPVCGDQFAAVKLDNHDQPTTDLPMIQMGKPLAGIFDDLDCQIRPATQPCTIGAVQMR